MKIEVLQELLDNAGNGEAEMRAYTDALVRDAPNLIAMARLGAVLTCGLAGGRDSYWLIPPACRRALIRHILFGQVAGDFIEAVLANDLEEAAGRADHENAPILHVYAGVLHNVAPKPSHGSRVAVEAWRIERKTEPFPAGGVSWPESWHADVAAIVPGWGTTSC